MNINRPLSLRHARVLPAADSNPITRSRPTGVIPCARPVFAHPLTALPERCACYGRNERSWRAILRFALSSGLLLVLSFVALSATAATRTWTGGHASSANWNLRDNWGGAAVPVNGDTLIFPSGAARLNNTNNIPGLQLAMIQFTGLPGGYTLRGQGVTLTNGITVIEGSDNTVRLNSIALGGAQTFHIPLGGGLTVWSNVVLNGFNLSIAAIGDLTLRGAISGNGNVSKSGAGQLSLSGAADNTFNGSLTIASGTLAMNKFEATSIAPPIQVSRIAVPGNLILGNGSGTVTATAQFDNQIANTATVTVRENAILDINDHDEVIGELVFQGGAVHTGTGVLIVNGDITANDSADTAVLSGLLSLTSQRTIAVAFGADLDISARIGSVGLWGITKQGPGTLRLSGANTYLGPTFIQAGTLQVGHESAFGSTSSGTFATNIGGLFIQNTVAVLREPLTVSGTGGGSLTGVIRLSHNGTIATNVVLSGPALIRTVASGHLTIDGVIGGAGPLRTRGSGTVELAGNLANNFTDGLRAEEGMVLLSKLAGGAVSGEIVVGTTNSTATVRHTRGSNVGGGVTVNAGSLYDLNGFDEAILGLTLIGGGDVETGDGVLTVTSDIVAAARPDLNGSVSTIHGALNVHTGTRNIIVAETGGAGGDAADLVIHARISGAAHIVKSGSGDLSLTASNSFTGSLTVQDGELHVAHGHALGSPVASTSLSGDSLLALSGGIDVEDETLFLSTIGQGNAGRVAQSRHQHLDRVHHPGRNTRDRCAHQQRVEPVRRDRGRGRHHQDRPRDLDLLRCRDECLWRPYARQRRHVAARTRRRPGPFDPGRAGRRRRPRWLAGGRGGSDRGVADPQLGSRHRQQLRRAALPGRRHHRFADRCGPRGIAWRRDGVGHGREQYFHHVRWRLLR